MKYDIKIFSIFVVILLFFQLQSFCQPGSTKDTVSKDTALSTLNLIMKSVNSTKQGLQDSILQLNLNEQRKNELIDSISKENKKYQVFKDSIEHLDKFSNMRNNDLLKDSVLDKKAPYNQLGSVFFDSSCVDKVSGQIYRTMKIGNLTWMAENLNSPVPGSCCRNNDVKNCDEFGRYYTIEAALEACPKGWHLSSDYEWRTLEKYFGMIPEDTSKFYNLIPLIANKKHRRFIANKLKLGGDSGFDVNLAGFLTKSGSIYRSSPYGYSAYFWAFDGKIDLLESQYIYARKFKSSSEKVFRKKLLHTKKIPSFLETWPGKLYSVRCVKGYRDY
ncbi:MAG: FISUMP domain-containing protein [Bacteroidota bacterium]